ncbi:calmodulin-like protein 2 [Andrographis paniculata]|uniref:calmodulin-like protein 2 n=1 Tax=Andrographis paniculata TaxID=175694 RepID=UPI0021E99368|nr:calmodulin-like protein 2 [Andrographis paniculata]
MILQILLWCLLFLLGGTLFSRKLNLPPWPLQSKTPPRICKNNTTKFKIDLMRDVFKTFDKNNDGFITRQELKESLKNIGISAADHDVADMVRKVDANGDGLIDLDEFCNLFEDDQGGPSDACHVDGDDDDDDGGDLREAFEVFDGNKDGLITVEELGLVLSSLGFSEGSKLEACKEMIRKVDMDGDGKVDFHEFKKMMRDGLKGIVPTLSNSKN